MKYYLLGKNSFIGKNIYKILKQNQKPCVLLSHCDLCSLKDMTDQDILVNVSGVNKASTWEEYREGNELFVEKIVHNLGEKRPYIIHLSSLMVVGFKNKQLTDLAEGNQWFIRSKLAGEEYLQKNYDSNKLCILRPSNIYGYDCIPYYNNLLSTMVFEKVKKEEKICKINRNCYRNMLSVENLCSEIVKCIENKTSGVWNVLSSNTVSLEVLFKVLWKNTLPSYLKIEDGMEDFPNDTENNICVLENLEKEIEKLETDMKMYYKIKESISIERKNELIQERGNMTEISSLQSKRLYKITINKNMVRGNHYHYVQIEDFFVNSGKVVYLLAHCDNPSVVLVHYGVSNELVSIKPNIIHTVINDFPNNISEIFVCSTQEYIPGNVPDTKYINLF